MVCFWVADCNVADDICADLYVREKQESGGVVLGAVYTVVYVCGIFKYNDSNTELIK